MCVDSYIHCKFHMLTFSIAENDIFERSYRTDLKPKLWIQAKKSYNNTKLLKTCKNNWFFTQQVYAIYIMLTEERINLMWEIYTVFTPYLVLKTPCLLSCVNKLYSLMLFNYISTIFCCFRDIQIFEFQEWFSIHQFYEITMTWSFTTILITQKVIKT